MAISFEQAEKILNGARRYELRDHAFGEREITWVVDEHIGASVIADGYSGSSGCFVTVYEPGGYDREANGEEVVKTDFDGYEARKLLKCGLVGAIERNDSTGPDTYVDGRVMPALTLEGVLRELTGG